MTLAENLNHTPGCPPRPWKLCNLHDGLIARHPLNAIQESLAWNTHRRSIGRQRSPYGFGCPMSPPYFLSGLLVLVLLNIRKFRTFRRERRYKVAYSDVCIWDRAAKRGLVGVMPVSAWRIVTFKYMNIVACMRELPIGNESTECLMNVWNAFGLQYDVPWPCADDGNFVDGPFKLVGVWLERVRRKGRFQRDLSILRCACSNGGEKCENGNYPNHDSRKAGTMCCRRQLAHHSPAWFICSIPTNMVDGEINKHSNQQNIGL